MLRKLITLVILVLSTNFVFAQANIGAVTLYDVNVRSQPGTDGDVVGILPSGRDIVAEARNDAGDWALIRTADGSTRGWVAMGLIQFDRALRILEELPASNEVVGRTAAPAAADNTAAPQPVNPAPNQTENAISGESVAYLNVRAESSPQGDKLGTLNPGTQLAIQGRNPAGDWLLVSSKDGSLRGWVAAGYVRFSRPIQIMQDLTVGTLNQEVLPDGLPAAPPPESTDYPDILLNSSILRNVDRIWQRGRQLGRQPNSMMKIGESNIAGTVFLCNLEWRNYQLGEYDEFQTTIDYFSQTGSFCRNNVSAQEGFSSFAIFDPTWAPQQVCQPNETPLRCEIRRNQPSFAFVYIGIGDMVYITASEFRANLTRLTRELANQGVIPILATFSMSDDFRDGQPQAFNNVIREVARAERVPLIDVRATVYDYANRGTGADGYHLSVPNPSITSFAGDQYTYGRTLYEFQAMRVLHDLTQRLN